MKTMRALRSLLLLFFLSIHSATLAFNQTYELNVGDEFTVYTTYKSGTYAVQWDYDSNIVEPVSYIGSASTSVRFRAKAPSPSVGSVIQAVTYYMRNGTTSSGANRWIDDWKVYVKDNSTVSIDVGNFTLSPGDYQYVNAIVSNSGYSGKYTWSTSDRNVAYVSGGGSAVRIYAENPGNATITVTLDNGSKGQCYVTVLNVEPTSISIPYSLTAYVGEQTTVNSTLTPSNAQTTLSWYSSNTNVLTVNSSGKVYGVSEGTATVYARTANGKYSNDCNVTVKYRTATGVALSKSELYLPIGQQATLTANVTPSNAKHTLTWNSINPEVAIVSSTGVVVAKKSGTTNITVTTDNGCSATCEVVVPPNPSSISLPEKISILYGKKRTLQCAFEPENAYKAVEWSSSAPDIVSVDAKGTITALKPGSAVVTALSSNGLRASCNVEVEAPLFNFVVWTHNGETVAYNLASHPVLSRSGDKIILATDNEIVEYPTNDVWKFTLEDKSRERLPLAIELPSEVVLEHRQEILLEHSLLPHDYDIETVLEWVSDNPSVVTVDNDGKIKAVGVGAANITVTAANGASATCIVTVPVPTYYIIAWLHDGRRDAYALSEHPGVRYMNGELLITTSLQQMAYPVEAVWKFTLADTDNPPVTSLPTVEYNAGMDMRGGDILFTGCPPGSKINVFTADGRIFATQTADADGEAVLQTADYPSGVYIIQSETITYKIIKR